MRDQDRGEQTLLKERGLAMFDEGKPAFTKVLAPFFMIVCIMLILAVDGANAVVPI